ncbi:hypothetical protein C477_12492 [Haloterrigena salina JCM 13891]|uniref:Uncharacterized protein n=1 Tax=Haloterrigena salina JCM 13891 TaxID=1227488 RepID=M0C4B9_9EURY|nr:hypothetical protein [Haloterrigena salina]ELZ18025.1 hypothetical protein C477_12492 [Haloterrigena salina JCM 13891]
MAFRRDERAVTVQIGTVLLLAIVFAALALYQLNAVPAENERVEFTHNQAVHDELQELRNAIQNVGAEGGTRSTAVTLGTQYPSRTVAANPPAPTGRLETTGTETISIDARFAGEESEYEGDPHNLTGNHSTTTLAYTPAYREYDSAPTTRIEHGFAFNEFDDAQVSLTDQPLLSDGTIRLVVLEGELSRSGSGAVTVDPTALSGPSDPVPIEGEGDENVTITVPTAAPTAWNDTIGTTFDDGQSDARVTDYDATDEGRGSLTVELAAGEYELQVTRVGIGDGGDSSGEYDVTASTDGDGERNGGAYTVSWADNHDSARACDDGESCDYRVYSGETATFAADAAAESATLDFAYQTSGPTVSEFNESDQAVDFEAEGSGDVDLFVSSGGSSDTITVRVEHDEIPPSIEEFEASSGNHNNHARFTVNWRASSGDAPITRGTLELLDDAGAVVDTWEKAYPNRDRVVEDGIELEEKNGSGNEYEIRLAVTDGNGNSRNESIARTG